MNNYPFEIDNLHIELTDKCQASCPMCARNYRGGAERSFVGQHEITLENFKSWISPAFIKKLKYFYACGNYGDPIIAKDCLEIFQYVREQNDQCGLSIHTNGSARSTAWWKHLAEILLHPHKVTFGIDGFEKSHVLYRRGTSWNKIIENASAFIQAGGRADVDCLVFKHNQDELVEFKNYMIELGFENVNFKSTGRFYDMENFPVEDQNGNIEYYLEPADAQDYKVISFLKLDEISKNIDIWKQHVDQSSIHPKCHEKKEIYIDCKGNVLPCCWVGSDILDQHLEIKMPIHKLRNLAIDNSKTHFKEFMNMNLSEKNLDNILKDDAWNHYLESKPWTCVKNCSK